MVRSTSTHDDDGTAQPFYFQRDIARNRTIGEAHWDIPEASGSVGDSAKRAGHLILRLWRLGPAAVLDARTSVTPPPASLRIGGNHIGTKSLASLAGLIDRGGVVSLDMKVSCRNLNTPARLTEEGGLMVCAAS